VIGEPPSTYLSAANSKRRAALPCALTYTYRRQLASVLYSWSPAQRNHGRLFQAKDDEEEEPQGSCSECSCPEARTFRRRLADTRRHRQRRQAGHARDWRRVSIGPQGGRPDSAARAGVRKRRNSQQGATRSNQGRDGAEGELVHVGVG
jgi:hypothetical protein